MRVAGTERGCLVAEEAPRLDGAVLLYTSAGWVRSDRLSATLHVAKKSSPCLYVHVTLSAVLTKKLLLLPSLLPFVVVPLN